MGDDMRNDVLVFDTDKLMIKKVAKGGIFNFISKGKASASASDNKVVSLVKSCYDQKPHLIEFSMAQVAPGSLKPEEKDRLVCYANLLRHSDELKISTEEETDEDVDHGNNFGGGDND